MVVRSGSVALLLAATLTGCVIRQGPGSSSGSNGTSSSTGGPIAVQSTEANFAPIALTSGFTPDPARLTGRSGGTNDATQLGGPCRGWVASRPDHIMTLNSSFNFFRIFVHSQADTTLVVQTPGGQFLCDDDTGSGTNPLIELGSWAPGTYRVWVGSYQQGEYADYTLNFTELQSQM